MSAQNQNLKISLVACSVELKIVSAPNKNRCSSRGNLAKYVSIPSEKFLPFLRLFLHRVFHQNYITFCPVQVNSIGDLSNSAFPGFSNFLLSFIFAKTIIQNLQLMPLLSIGRSLTNIQLVLECALTTSGGRTRIILRYREYK